MSKGNIIILDHIAGRRLANQLWNFASIYAYSLETGRNCFNYSFFEYASLFPNLARPPFFVRLYTGYFFALVNFLFPKKISAELRRCFYKIFVRLYTVIRPRSILYSKDENGFQSQYYLPPTKTSKGIASLDRGNRTMYFIGWMFRNPEGLVKWRKEIREAFRPRAGVVAMIDKRLKILRNRYDHIIGVHLRQEDYKEFYGGKFFIDEKRSTEILSEYLAFSGYPKDRTLFIIASDATVDPASFKEFRFEIAGGTAPEDLFLLSQCDTIIGSNSTFGAFAAYYGDIPHLVMTKEPMDWEYYRGKPAFFENKYDTFTHF